SSTGTMTVTITGLPSGVNASVNLVNGGSSQTVTQTTTLASVASGTYTVSADIVTQADPIVRTAFKGTVSVTTAQVCDGETANVDVTYAAIPTSNKIWWGNQNGENATLGYASANLSATGSPTADIAAATDNAVAGEFDPEGNLWAIDGVSKSIKRFTADSLATGGTKTADIEITGDELTGGVPGPATLTFDSKGNLYVGITFSKTIVRFDHESLSATGSPTPAATITVPDVASSIAFDKNGLLWAGCANDRVVSLSHAHDAGAVTAAPDVSIDAMSPAPAELTAPAGLAFDADGDLWVDYNGTFAKLSAADQSGTGDKTVTPAVQVVSDVLTLPGGMSFDESGGLWYAYTSGHFAKLSAAQLTTSSTATPSVIVTSSSVVYALNPALYPAPKALPLWSALQK
ncbi:MAG: SMP-30/gluconolactonase/LRE family protein, partial [Polyangiaceae bacterium]